MKQLRIFALAIMALFILTPQVKADTKIGGIRTGYQSSYMFLDGSQTGSTLDNFYVGFFRDNKVIPLLHITSGLEYFQNGYNSYKMHTLSIPVSAKLKVGPVYGLVGVSGNIKISDSGSSGQNSKSSWFDYPLHAGIGVSILMVGLEARYHWGMNEVWPSGEKAQYLQIGATLAF